MTGYIKHLLATLVALLVSLPSWSADGDTFYANTVEGVRMRFNVISEADKTCKVQSYCISSTYEGEITIPSLANGYTITQIGDYAFQNCSALNPVNIPEEVIRIGSFAFQNCSALTTITIPKNVKSIGGLAFDGCSSLNSVTIIPENMLEALGGAAFRNCSSLTSIVIPNVEVIQNGTFEGCSALTSVTIHDGVEFIDNGAFKNCSALTTITIPESLKYMGRGVFDGCTSLPVEDNIRYAGTCAIEVIDKTQMTYKVREGTKSLYYTFEGCTDVMKITLPSTLKVIGSSAFRGCNGLISISIPEGVKVIKDSAFYGCSALTSINIPEGVTEIQSFAFQDCSTLTTVNLPKSLISIGNEAFRDCSSLTSIIIPEGVTSINRGTFIDCSSLTSIDIPSSVKSISEGAFQSCTSLTSVNISKGTTIIGYQAFVLCSALTSIVIPEGVTVIGDWAFNGCSALTSINIPSSVTSIGSGTFGNCYRLSSLVIDCGNISTSGLFKNLTQLRNVTIGDNMTMLYNETFSGCSNLESVTIGSGMEYIRTDAFKGCTRIKTIECDAEEPPYCYPNVFADIDASCKVIVPSASKEAYTNNEQWGKFLIQGPSIDLTDGSTFTGYSKEKNMEQITYSRTFKNTNWQAWYVPFEVELTSDLLSRFSFAKYAGTYVDENSDPSFFITIARLKAGDKLKANTPYFVQAKTASNTAQVISVANTTLKAAQETGFDMYSAEQKVSIRGVYSAKTATAGDCDWYAYGGGSYFKATAGAVLNPYRVYLTITERDDNPYGTSEVPNEIKVKLLGDDGATIIEEVQGTEEVQDAQIYDLSGRRIMKDKLDKGIYIINGKKVLVK